MHNRRLPILIRCFLIATIIFFSITNVIASDQTARADLSPFAVEKRVDLIIIDTLSTFKPLKRPAVYFLHDKHTEAVEKRNKDCRTCHPETKGQLSAKFKREKDQSYNQSMVIYHDNCIGCHKENTIGNIKSGPVTCGECHVQQRDIISTRQPMELDKSLHYRHVLALDKKCELCHHEYDAENKKLFYAKGEEGTCRYCHKIETEENRISFRRSSHKQCINCHREKLAQDLNGGPIYCQGCHLKEAQQKIEKIIEIPRMERNQPDVVLIGSFTREKAGIETSKTPTEGIAPVAFNHKVHEISNNTCRNCHHASMAACTGCHTSMGNKDGQNIRLSQAMHKRDATSSCIGCHRDKQNSSKCAGCHSSIGTKETSDVSTCQTCHLENWNSKEQQIALTKEEAEVIAFKLIESRNTAMRLYSLEQIPEKILIKKLTNQYQPVELPHRKIISKLIENIKGDKVAQHFHQDPGTLCQGCHHNSPPSKTPPACGSCHGSPLDVSNAMRPGLMGAYHQQCFQCHTEMEIKKPATRNCTACHPKKEEASSDS
ncbi:MAG: cytochrome c3 family protein [Desulfobacteraceae bacterium]|jgi:hypothetical protein